MEFDTHDLVTRYVAVWNEPDPARRREAVASLWAEDAVERVEEAEWRGLAELENRVAEAHEALVAGAGYTATHYDPLAHHDAVTFTINLVKNGEIAWAARVFLIVGADDLIRYDYHFTTRPMAS
ncbi:hypothetical protein AB0L06_42345 [Spirillospora sp. NPDC052269]